MLVLHANWSHGALHVWGESLEAYLEHKRHAAPEMRGSAGAATAVAAERQAHPFALPAQELLESLSSEGIHESFRVAQAGMLRLRLPRSGEGPMPSERLERAAIAGQALSDEAEVESEWTSDPWLGEFEVPSVALPAENALGTLLALANHRDGSAIDLSQATRYWIEVGEFLVDLLSDQRFIPTLVQTRAHGLQGFWRPWLHDEDARRRAGALVRSMPPIVRASVDDHQGRPWLILEEALSELCDAFVREALIRESFIDAIENRDAAADPNVAWLSGLLGKQREINASSDMAHDLLRDASQWVSRLEDTGQDRPWHLCFRLNEPEPALEKAKKAEPVWRLSIHLQSADDPDQIVDAAQVWGHAPADQRAGGLRIEDPQGLLLAELGRASQIYPPIEAALSQATPTQVELTTAQAYDFLRNVWPVLEESGFEIIVPSWWDQPIGRLAARLHVEPLAPSTDSTSAVGSTQSLLGLNSLVKFHWQLAIGDQPLTAEEFQALAKQTAPLVQVRGRWIEISPKQLADAKAFLEQTPAGEMTLLEAIQIAHGADHRELGLPVHGMDASGWIADVLSASSNGEQMPRVEQPDSFLGSLRPYQKSGLSWLAFLDRFGLGACLADDMGLGKTIQLIALLQYERQQGGPDAAIGPTLLIAPTSVISNWGRELSRFAPNLTAHIHHGPERPLGDRFVELAQKHDMVITTYPLISRDHETLRRVKWHRVALDEAQYIKNPPTKQTTAIRSLQTTRRIALTGTPVENRLSELWSIMEFCNPGYLGPAGEFRRRFAIPVERHRDQQQAERLRSMVRPFILRRVKTDPTVISDLPECLETKEYATLTAEQATLYQNAVSAMLGDVDRSQGIQRRGLVLATLVRLKQICNHPETGAPHGGNGKAHEALKHGELNSLAPRSGKARRLMAMLEEVLATGEKALIFTQFRQMGHLLTAMIQSELDREALFLHGGTPTAKRQQLIDRFQDDHGGAPIFVLSLKAGGLGLNLTAANHVFHYDRWWNPAVESQATDRAFRIGQTRTVHVHKFICVGTLEERIDQMIEQKTELAQNIIGAGEQWLTELSTTQLQELLALRPSAVEGEA